MKKLFIGLMYMAAVLLCGCSGEDEPAPGPEPVPGVEEPASVHGSVVINGEPVNAAAILLTPGGGVKITGSDGMYNFTDLVPGKYELKVFKEGCQSLNKSIELAAGRDEELVFTLAESEGGLSINKSYIDMGANESNNVAGFTIKNDGAVDISWQITNAAPWITEITPEAGSVPAAGATAVSFTINRSRLSSITTDNYATLLVRSTTQGDGSVAELLVTVFGSGNGTNTSNDNSGIDYVMVGDLYVQTRDVSASAIDWESAQLLCENSTVGDFNDWRLPTIEELATIYNNKAAIGGFNDSISNSSEYWSSTIPENSTSNRYYLDFFNGQRGSLKGTYDMYARAVRKDVAPTVSVLDVSDISETSVTFNGRIDNNDAVKCSERGFVYSTEHLPTVADTKVQSFTPQSSAEYSAEVCDLSFGSAYYIRAYAVANRTDTVYSDELTFRYDSQLPVVSTQPVTDIDTTTAVLHGSIESKGIPAYTERGFVYSTIFKNPTIESDEKVVVNGTDIGDFSANLSGLEKDVTYYVRAYATNSEGTAYGEAVSFEVVRQLPVVTTLPVTDIGATTAVLHGTIESEGIPAYTERGFVYSTVFDPTIESGEKVIVNGTSVGDFSANLSGLEKDVTYYVRAYATNSDGTAYGEAVSFKVAWQLPKVTTLPVSDIGESTAVLHGAVETEGVPAYTERGFVYSTVFTNPAIESDEKIVVSGTGIGEFSANLSGLEKDVTYYVRAYAINGEGVSYGDVVSFEVVRQLPVVTTLPVTDIDATTAVLHGTVVSEGIPKYTERGFVYSTTFTNPTIETDSKVVANGNKVGKFEYSLMELTTGVEYFVRAYAINSDGTAYGETVSFRPEHPDYVILEDAGLMVQKKDLGNVPWEDANILCQSSTIGGFNDWRLPTKEELGVLYNNRVLIGNFSNIHSTFYWSSTVGDNTSGGLNVYYVISFINGSFSLVAGNSYNDCYVRAVRSLP